MWDMAKQAITLFFQGKLFQDNKAVFRQIAIGVVATAVLLVILSALGAPLVLAAILAGLVGGAFQPFLLKDLKYR